MKILSFITSGNKGMTFESMLFDLPLKRFCKENGYELLNIDIEQLIMSPHMQNQHNALTVNQRVGNYILQQITKYQADIIFIPVGNNNDQNVFMPGVPGITYVVTRDHNLLTPQSIPDGPVVVMNNLQRKALGGRGIKMFPPLNDLLFYSDPEGRLEDYDKNEVSFFGRYSEKRFAMLKYLQDNGVKIHAYGEGWYDQGMQEEFTRDGIRVASRRNVSFQRHILSNTKIGLVMAECIKPVHFEVAACGALLVSNTGKSFFKQGQEFILPTFKTKEELLDAIRRFLDNVSERTALAEKQRLHVLEKYNTAAFFKRLFKRIMKEYRSGEKQ